MALTAPQFEARWRHDLAHAEKTLLKDGVVAPLFVVVGRDGGNHVVPADFGTPEAKARAYDGVRLLAVAHDADMVMVRAESWLVLGRLPEGVAPSQSDRRIEVVSVVASARVGRRVVHRSSLREIVRGLDGRPTGLRAVEVPGVQGKEPEARGPMFDLLPPRRPSRDEQAMAAVLVEAMVAHRS